MPTFITLLRGVNVAQKNSIRMAELVASCSAWGFTNVVTYIQSGNIVFDARGSDTQKHARTIRAGITKDFGHDVGAVVLTRAEIERIASSNPLLPKGAFDGKLYHATFLIEPVRKAAFDALELPIRGDERALLCGSTVLLHCPHGYGSTKLNNLWFEKALGVPATTRNWRTVEALRELAARA